jgi:ABC-type polysaccharide/polyol phosphate export permease
VAALRILKTGFVLNLKMLGTSSFFLLTSIVQPIIFATIAFYMFRSGGRAGTLLYAALGAGMMGVWSTTLFASGGMIQWQRWQGTLELGVGSPPNLVLLYLPFSLANAVTGGYSLAATLLWGRVLFGVPLHLAHPWLFALAVPAAVLALGLLGLVLASTFVLYRYANAMANLLEYPVWVASGLVFSVSLLPAWTRPISWLLPPYWGVLAIRHAALGGEVWLPLGMLALLGVGSLALATVTMRWFEHLARARATLALT